MTVTRRDFLHHASLLTAGLVLPVRHNLTAMPVGPTANTGGGRGGRPRSMTASSLDLNALARFVDPLPIPPKATPVAFKTTSTGNAPVYRMPIRQVEAKVHRDLPPTRFWSFGATFPGPTIDVHRGHGIWIEWTNGLPSTHLLPIDHTIHGAEADKPQSRAVVHVHGAKVRPESDGNPEHWLSPGMSATYFYPNDQDAATLWYHDHTMGINRLNVYAGLIGAYLIRDDVETALNLPSGSQEVPLIVCDRFFDDHAQLSYPVSDDPAAPWVPEVFGDGMLVNGKLFPYLDAEPRLHRLRIVNACNGRFLNLSVSSSTNEVLPLHQIGADQGLLPSTVAVRQLVLAPAERADVIVDVSGHAGDRLVVTNDQQPMMEIRVARSSTADRRQVPTTLRPMARLAESSAIRTRTHTLAERTDLIKRPMQMLLNDTMWHMPVTETVTLGSTEIWNLVNMTDDSHPIHLHLVRFQILDRRKFDAFEYQQSGTLRYVGPPAPPEPGEGGWKDTVRAHPGMATRIIIHFEGFAGRYMWHCHILEHGDNEMMRPFQVVGE